MSIEAISAVDAQSLTGTDIDMKHVEKIINELDFDKDKALSLTESNFEKEIFMAMDTNGDNKLTNTELYDGLKLFQGRAKSLETLINSGTNHNSASAMARINESLKANDKTGVDAGKN
jgi:hypothetical protein